MNTEETLCKELKDYCIRNGLPYMSADDLLWRDDLPEGGHEWLQEFIERFDNLFLGERNDC